MGQCGLVIDCDLDCFAAFLDLEVGSLFLHCPFWFGYIYWGLFSWVYMQWIYQSREFFFFFFEI